jgi:hypothetical protein
MNEGCAKAAAGQRRITAIELYDWAEILRASRFEGQGMVDRLVAEFASGANRFDAPGEMLLAFLNRNTVVAVGGLNREFDPDYGNAGRIRRLYVMPGIDTTWRNLYCCAIIKSWCDGESRAMGGPIAARITGLPSFCEFCSCRRGSG